MTILTLISRFLILFPQEILIALGTCSNSVTQTSKGPRWPGFWCIDSSIDKTSFDSLLSTPQTFISQQLNVPKYTNPSLLDLLLWEVTLNIMRVHLTHRFLRKSSWVSPQVRHCHPGGYSTLSFRFVSFPAWLALRSCFICSWSISLKEKWSALCCQSLVQLSAASSAWDTWISSIRSSVNVCRINEPIEPIANRVLECISSHTTGPFIWLSDIDFLETSLPPLIHRTLIHLMVSFSKLALTGNCFDFIPRKQGEPRWTFQLILCLAIKGKGTTDAEWDLQALLGHHIWSYSFPVLFLSLIY